MYPEDSTRIFDLVVNDSIVSWEVEVQTTGDGEWGMEDNLSNGTRKTLIPKVGRGFLKGEESWMLW